MGFITTGLIFTAKFGIIRLSLGLSSRISWGCIASTGIALLKLQAGAELKAVKRGSKINAKNFLSGSSFAYAQPAYAYN